MDEAQDRSSGTASLFSAMEASELEIGQCYSPKIQGLAESSIANKASSPDLSQIFDNP
jgi:hypothetical protein